VKKACERCLHPKEDHHGTKPCDACAKTDRAELCCGYVDSQLSDLAEQLAKDILTLATVSGMPDSYWQTDNRIKRACETLDWTIDAARDWAGENA
jgi:hypothetical protein